MVLPLQGGIEVVGFVGALPGPQEADVQNVAQHLLQWLAVLFIDAQQEEGQHDQDHAQRRRAAPQRPFEQKEKRDAQEGTAAEADKLALGEVERHLGFYFGQVLGDRDIGHYRVSSFFVVTWGLGGTAAAFSWSWASVDFFVGAFRRRHNSSRAKLKSLRSSMRCSQ